MNPYGPPMTLSMTISINLNEELKSVPHNCTLKDALFQWGYECEDIAVAINATFVPRSRYSDHQLHDKDCVDVVSPMQGG